MHSPAQKLCLVWESDKHHGENGRTYVIDKVLRHVGSGSRPKSVGKVLKQKSGRYHRATTPRTLAFYWWVMVTIWWTKEKESLNDTLLNSWQRTYSFPFYNQQQILKYCALSRVSGCHVGPHVWNYLAGARTWNYLARLRVWNWSPSGNSGRRFLK